MGESCSSSDMDLDPTEPSSCGEGNETTEWFQSIPSQMPWSIPFGFQPNLVTRGTGRSKYIFDSSRLSPCQLVLKKVEYRLSILIESSRTSSSFYTQSLQFSHCDSSYLTEEHSTLQGLVTLWFSKEGINAASLHCKRKHDTDDEVIQHKQLITEEKMAARLSEIHITYDDKKKDNAEKLPPSQEIWKNQNSQQASQLSPQSQEKNDKKKNIILSEEIKKFRNEPILPSTIFQKSFRDNSSMAVVLWKPPGGIIDDILSRAGIQKRESTSGCDDVAEDGDPADHDNYDSYDNHSQRYSLTYSPSQSLVDNNNSNVVDLNSLMRQRKKETTDDDYKHDLWSCE